MAGLVRLFGAVLPRQSSFEVEPKPCFNFEDAVVAIHTMRGEDDSRDGKETT